VEGSLMPNLKTTLHLDMFNAFKRRNRFLPRLFRTLTRELFAPKVYGLEWGDPDIVEPLKFVRDRFVLPYVNAQHRAVEVGPGGGRWTRYLLGFKQVYVIDYHSELLQEVQKHFRRPNVTFIQNNGSDFPGIREHSIDYLFSFGVFVHLESDLIESYLNNMQSVLKPGANAILQYSDKTKIMAQNNTGFANNTPEKMRAMVSSAGYRILEEDLTTLWHSSIIRFTPCV
jgi:hypothetical protein